VLLFSDASGRLCPWQLNDAAMTWLRPCRALGRQLLRRRRQQQRCRAAAGAAAAAGCGSRSFGAAACIAPTAAVARRPLAVDGCRQQPQEGRWQNRRQVAHQQEREQVVEVVRRHTQVGCERCAER
jgi:hypothetical protein